MLFRIESKNPNYPVIYGAYPSSPAYPEGEVDYWKSWTKIQREIIGDF
jgi:hypothetical protein